MKPSLKQPGVVVSVIVHAAILLASLFVFSDAPKFEDAQEAVAVEVVTDAQMNQIMKGDKTSKEIKPQPKPKVDKVADTEVQKPTPPTPDAKRDVPTPPPALKRLPDPGQDNSVTPKPEPKPAPAPPVKPPEQKPEPPKPEPVTPAPPKPVVPAPPVRVVTPPAPEPPKPDAEIVRPAPPKRQDLAKLIEKTAPEPTPKPEPVKKPEPPAPPKPKVRPHSKPVIPPEPKTDPAKVQPAKTEPAKVEPPKPKFDEVAKLLEQKKLDELAKTASQAAAKPKSGDEKAAPTHAFNVADINKLLSKDAAQNTGSTGKQVNSRPNAGAQTASAQKMSPNLKAQLDGWLVDRYHSCWDLPITLPTGPKYVPKVLVNLNPDGSLASSPQLLNPPSDPADKPLADSAVRAVVTCNPLKMPPHFQAYYAEWKSRAVVFDPEDR